MKLVCWCGNRELVPFGDAYVECQNCTTLVSRHQPDDVVGRVLDDAKDFYGREYWLSHVTHDLKQGNVMQRARTDLPERCLHWLRTTLMYMLPPGRILEVGSGPGTFVAMLRWAGFDATGLELSPWVVDYSQRAFDIPVLTGPVEDQNLEPRSLDAIVMMDVLEHLSDPAATMRCCARLLKPDGLLLVQTPRYPGATTYQRLIADAHPFLDQLKPEEHLYLFSDHSIRRLFTDIGLNEVVAERAIFAHYDMFVLAGQQRLMTHATAAVETALQAQPSGRLALALLDLDERLKESEGRLVESEADRGARLRSIEALQTKLQESESDRAARLTSIEQLQTLLQECEADRAARLDAVNDLSLRLAAMDEELNRARQELSQPTGREAQAGG